jgi:hypothetical protein
VAIKRKEYLFEFLSQVPAEFNLRDYLVPLMDVDPEQTIQYIISKYQAKLPQTI